MKNKKVTQILLVSALAGLTSIGGMLAYFSDADTKTNTFTVGKISLDVQEPDWNPENGRDMTPMKTIPKNPQICNDGINEEFVFLEVLVPYAQVVTANADGTKNPASDTELFFYKVNPGWMEMTEERKVTENTVRHLYVWGTKDACTVLKPDVTTRSLFDTVTMANVVEDQGLEETNPEIVINGYGIQTSDLDGGKTSPAEVWKILHTQNPDTAVDVAEDANTDVKETAARKEQESPEKSEGKEADSSEEGKTPEEEKNNGNPAEHSKE